MKKGFKWNRRGVSPVIATIIIVAIAIVMSIAVAYWMLGLGASFTKYEKIEFTSAYTVTSGTDFVVHMDLKNTGSAAATVDPSYLLYNGMPATAFPTAYRPAPTFTTFTLQPGQNQTDITINFAMGGNWTSGMTIELTLHTAAGKDYPKVVTLP